MPNKTIAQYPQVSVLDKTDQILMWDDDAVAQKKCLPVQLAKSYHLKTRYLTEFTDINAAVTAISANIRRLIVSGSDLSRTLTANLSIPDNIEVEFEFGSPIIKSSTYTLNIENLVAGDYKIFSGFSAGNVTLGNSIINPAWWNAAITDVEAAQAVAAAPAGGIIDFPLSTSPYDFASVVTVNKSLRLTSAKRQELRQLSADTNLFDVTSDDVEIDHLKLTGPSATYDEGVDCINAYGADSSNYISGLKIHHVTITTWGERAIKMTFVEEFEIHDFVIKNIGHAGITGVSVRDGRINDFYIKNIDVLEALGTSYGIALTKENNQDSLVTYPRSSRVNVSDGEVWNVPGWEGVDTHAGEDITFSNLRIMGCKAGIAATFLNGTATTPKHAPLNTVISDCVVNSLKTDGTAGIGVQIAGAGNGTTVTEYATGSINNTIIKGHGDETSNVSGGVSLQDTKGINTRITAINCSPNGVHLRRFNKGFNVSGCAIVDPWSDTGDGVAVFVDDKGNSGYIGGNSFEKVDAGLGTNVLTKSIEITTFLLGNNPFATVNTSTTVTVTHTGHGLSTSDKITYIGCLDVNGIPAAELNTTHTITKIDADSYTITTTTPATSTAVGGGALISHDKGNIIELGPNHDSGGAIYLADLGQASLTGLTNFSVIVSDTGSLDFQRTIIRANEIGIGRRLKVTISGTITNANNGNKPLFFHLGSKSITVLPAADIPSSDWSLDVEIEFTAASSQKYKWKLTYSEFGSADIGFSGFETSAIDMTESQIMKMSTNLTDAADAVSQNMLRIHKY